MRPVGNFHPEWGYLAPAPSFVRTVRIILVAAAVGATAGAAVILSLNERPAAEASVAARTLARPAQTASPSRVQLSASQTPSSDTMPAVQPSASRTSSPQPGAPQVSAHAMAQQPQATTSSPSPRAAVSEPSSRATTQPPTGIAVTGKVPATTNAAAARRAPAPSPAASRAPLQKKAAKKTRASSHYASRGDRANGSSGAFRIFDDQSSFEPSGAADKYSPYRRDRSPYYREQRWGSYYPDESFSYR